MNMINAALILAAGKNTRFDTGIPKSLHQIGETTLLERHIRQFHLNGIQHVAIVTGYREHMISEYIHTLSQTLEYPVTLIHNPQFDMANGLSIRVAREWIESISAEHFICTMSDHLYAGSFYKNAISKFGIGQQIDSVLHLVVDKPGAHNSYIDLEDVTRVYAFEDESNFLKIIKVSKLMKDYNYFDTGFFILSNSVFNELDVCASHHKNSISDLVNHLSGQQKSYAIELTGQYWNDVDTPEDFKMVQKQLYLL